MVVTRVACIFLASIAIASCSDRERASESIRLRGPVFSVDGDKVFLDYCANRVCDLVMYSVADRTATKLRPENEKYKFGGAGLGPGHNQVVATYSDRDGAASRETQIVVLDLLANSYRLITSDASIKSAPNFSFDGQKLAYIQSHRDRTWFNGDPRATAWDIHTLDIPTGVSERVTSYCFWGLGRPFFYPASEDIVVHADGPMCNYPSVDAPAEAKGYLKYKERFGDNNIVRVGPNRRVLEPWITNGQHSSSPSVSRAGDVLFVSLTNNIDGIKKGYFNYDLFLRRGDSIRRLTQLNTIIVGSALSPDGRFAAYLSDPERDQSESLWVFDIEHNLHERIPIAHLLGSSSGTETTKSLKEAIPKELQVRP